MNLGNNPHSYHGVTTLSIMHNRGGETGYQSKRQAVPARQHYVCGSVALVVTVLMTVLTYSLLVSMTTGFGVLATTALVFVVALCWFLLWELLVVAWEWRAGRLPVSLAR